MSNLSIIPNEIDPKIHKDRINLREFLESHLTQFDRAEVQIVVLRLTMRNAWHLKTLKVKDKKKLDLFYFYWIRNLSAASVVSFFKVVDFGTFSVSSTFADTADATDAADAAAAANVAIISDYNFLLDYNGPLQNFWFSQPLWPDTPPEKFLTYKETLFKQLEDIGLGFLANDLNQLFDMQGDSSAHIPEHWTNYAKQFSEIELNDPETLRGLILGETEATEVNAVRMILLGPGGAGKTTLMDRLLGKEVIKDQPATVGIVHQQLPLDNAEVFGGCTVADNLQLFAWDFGGQTLFYGLHRSFLHENCVYVLVVDGRHEQSPDNWLYQICHLAEGKRTTVMLVSNRYENCQYQHNQQRLERLFGDFLELHFYGFACNEPDASNFQVFKEDLLKFGDASRHWVSKNLMDVSDQLEKLFLLGRSPVMSQQKLLSSLEGKLQNNTDNEQTIEKLKGLGRLVSIDSENERLCVDSNWLIDNAYSLLFYECLMQKDSLGLVSKASLKNEAEDNDLNAVDDLVQFLVNSGLCVSLDQERFFPDLARFNEPVYLPEPSACVILELQFPYLPLGLFARLVSHWMQQSTPCGIEKYEYVWRSGFILSHEDAPINITQEHYVSGSGLWVEYLSHLSIIRLNGFGSSKHIAELFLQFWQGLLNLKLEPLQATDILPLLAMDRRFMERQQNASFESACLWLKDIDEIKKVFKQIEESSKVADTIIHNQGKAFVQTGKKATMTNTFHEGEQGLSKDQLELILAAIKEIQETNQTLSDVQKNELVSLATQAEQDEIVPIYYDRMLEAFNGVGSAASIASVIPAISKMLGLS